MQSMLWKKLKEIDLKDLNNFLLILSLIIFLISLYFLNNIFLIIIVYGLLYYLYKRKERKRYLSLIIGILAIFVVACFLLQYIDLSFFKFDFLNLLKVFIKIWIYIVYFIIVVESIKDKNIKYVKGRKRTRTFNELRIKNIQRYKEDNLNLINKYQIENNINLDSDYYKVIKDNYKNKVKDDLEEYVIINYLRFYKNKKENKKNIFDALNATFILIHVIILLLAIFVR